jgi:uncharacterized protein (TIGR00730 family)
MRYATTFGSSTIKPNTKEYDEAILIGYELSKKGYTLKCGGYQGLMEAISIGAKRANGVCIGQCLEYFEDIREENTNLSSKVVHKDMFDRLRGLIEYSEIFIVQRGSLGTINELLMVWTLVYIQQLKARIVLIGDEWQDINNLNNLPIEKKLFEYLEFYSTAEEFLATVE